MKKSQRKIYRDGFLDVRVTSTPASAEQREEFESNMQELISNFKELDELEDEMRDVKARIARLKDESE
jgi:hypothetical protein